MKITTYPLVKLPESYYYEFYSGGPNGNIKKVVEHFRLPELEAEVLTWPLVLGGGIPSYQ